MSFFIKKISRRTLVQALIALPGLSLFRKQPDASPADASHADASHADPSRADPSHTGASLADPNEIAEINGWILKRSDLA